MSDGEWVVEIKRYANHIGAVVGLVLSVWGVAQWHKEGYAIESTSDAFYIYPSAGGFILLIGLGIFVQSLLFLKYSSRTKEPSSSEDGGEGQG